MDIDIKKEIFGDYVFSYKDNLEDNKSFITPFSIVHFITTIILFVIIKYFFNLSKITTGIIVIIIHLLYEIKDLNNIIKKKKNIKKYIPKFICYLSDKFSKFINKIFCLDKNYWSDNSIANTIGDQLVNIIAVILMIISYDYLVKYKNIYILMITILIINFGFFLYFVANRIA